MWSAPELIRIYTEYSDSTAFNKTTLPAGQFRWQNPQAAMTGPTHLIPIGPSLDGSRREETLIRRIHGHDAKILLTGRPL